MGPYVLQRVLGAGGMGTVHRAERADGAFEREVAIKIERIFNDCFAGLSVYEGLAEDRQVLGMIEPMALTLDQYGMTELASRYRALAAGGR